MRIRAMHIPRKSLFSLAFMLSLPCAGAWAQGYPTTEAVGRMTVADGFSVKLFASEPDVRQPILVKFDDRGRLWVIQYLQYPVKAGLKPVKEDQFQRLTYDRVPEPPPKGPRGIDRVTICEDTDGDGVADVFKDFLDDMNLATGLAFGHGGVFVIEVPYLLFYPDRNRDDVPDGDPEVCLKGFGMEDSQSFANHLTWGPDGWLYGLNGSTTTCNVRGIEFQQGVWRYHPISKEFELFCEGGGNIYGLTFDADGQLFYSSNGTRPSWHGVQGAYYHKNFGKHGQLHNPYTFGYFQFVPHTNYRGGHVTCGGTFYYGDSFPASFRGTYIGTNLLEHEVHWHRFSARGSTFRSHREGELVRSNDTWCAPTDLTVGPDGAVYFCDFHEKYTAHPNIRIPWDDTNGRVYQVQATGAKSAAHVDLNELSSNELVDWLDRSNFWYVRLARRILAERRDKSVVPRLRKMATESEDDHLALEALWALCVSGGFDDAIAKQLLGHRSVPVRFWTVRLLGDARKVSGTIASQLTELARAEPSPVVRSQLACTAKRLPAAEALPVVWQLLLRDEDLKDPHIPLLLWWAIESKAASDRAAVLDVLTAPEAWKTPLVQEVIHHRLMQRYAAEGTEQSLDACADLLAKTPDDESRIRMVTALDGALGAGKLKSMPEALRNRIAKLIQGPSDSSPVQLRMALRQDVSGAHERVARLAADTHMPTPYRVSLVELLGEAGKPSCLPVLLSLLEPEEQHDVEVAAVKAIGRFDDPSIPAKVLKEYPRFSAKLKGLCLQTLITRKHWTLAFLRKFEEKEFDPKDVTIEELLPTVVYQDEEINELVRKHWGKITAATAKEKLAEIARLEKILAAGQGDPGRGKELFKEHCAKCHRMFGDGENIGPDLTNANRKDRNYVLVSIVDPSSLIRVEFLPYQIITDDGRIFSGLVIDQTPTILTLADSQGELTKIPRESIDEMVASEISQMAEDALKPLEPQQIRDLFSFLESDEPKQ